MTSTPPGSRSWLGRYHLRRGWHSWRPRQRRAKRQLNAPTRWGPLTHKTLSEVAAVPPRGLFGPTGPNTEWVVRTVAEGRFDGPGRQTSLHGQRRSLRRAAWFTRRRRRSLKAYLFVSPAMVLFLAFIAIPVVGIVVFSFLQWDLLTPPKFAGVVQFPHAGP